MWNKMNLDLYLITCTKTNSKWIKNPHVKAETIKFLAKTIEYLPDFDIGKMGYIGHKNIP